MELVDQGLINPNSSEFYKNLLTKDGKHPAYKETVKQADDLAPIVFGETPKEILEKFRPNDPDPIKNYRLNTYEPEVKGWYMKVYNTLKSGMAPGSYTPEWKEPPSNILKGEDPKTYFNKKFSEFGSIHNYFQDVVMNKLNGDPGAVMVVLPVLDENASEYQTIIPVIYPAKYVYWYSDDIIVIALNHNDEERHEKKVFLTLTEDKIIIATGKDEKNDEFDFEDFENLFGKLLGVRLGGNYVQKYGHVKYPESFIYGVVPHWNKAIRYNSDLDAQYVTSFYAQRIQIEVPCSTCKGKKYTAEKDLDGDRIKCRTCDGRGIIMGGSPYSVYTINPTLIPDFKASDVVSYAAPPVDIVEAAEKKVEALYMAGLSALNMDEAGFRETGANESGYKKALDRKELTAFLSEYTNRVIDLMEWAILRISFFRYFNVVSNVESILPVITRPHRFDQVTVEELYNKLKTAKDANAHPSIIRQIQKDIALKEFGNQSGANIGLEIDLDPFPGYTIDQLLSLDSLTALPELQVYIKANLTRLIEKAMTDDFRAMSIAGQREEIQRIAEEEMAMLPPPPDQFNLERQLREMAGEDNAA